MPSITVSLTDKNFMKLLELETNPDKGKSDIINEALEKL